MKPKAPARTKTKPPKMGDKAIPRTMRQYLAREVAAGFKLPQEILGAAMEEYAGDEGRLPRVTQADAQGVLDALLAAHQEKQAKWKRPTDCERLDSAFQALDQGGIVARQNWTTCVTDGLHEMAAEMAAVRPGSGQVMGYAFYHAQDLEDAVKDGQLMVSFGSVSGRPRDTKAVGEEIVRTLEQAGLSVDWPGDPGARIEVSLKWRRVRPR